jgi:hypothetical protein
VGILAAIACALWRAAAFFAPKFTEITEAHLQFVATVSEQTARLTRQAEQQTTLLASQHELLKEHGRILAEIQSGINALPRSTP